MFHGVKPMFHATFSEKTLTIFDQFDFQKVAKTGHFGQFSQLCKNAGISEIFCAIRLKCTCLKIFLDIVLEM